VARGATAEHNGAHADPGDSGSTRGEQEDSMDREYEPNSDDEREVDLDGNEETLPPPTIDPDERVERPETEDGERPFDEDERPA